MVNWSIKKLTIVLYWGVAGLFVSASSHAALIGLTPSFPDVGLSSATVDYVFTNDTCQNLLSNNSPSTGECGTSGGNGNNSFDYNGDLIPGGGALTISGSNLQLRLGDEFGTTGAAVGSYSLTANFDTAGNVVDGSLLLSGNFVYSGGTNPGFSFGDPLPGFQGTTGSSTDLVDFGFSLTPGGVLEFVFANATGDLPTYAGSETLFVIVGMSNTGTLSLNDSFSTTATVDTFVPLPAAAWLFLSAFSGLLAVKRAKV